MKLIVFFSILFVRASDATTENEIYYNTLEDGFTVVDRIDDISLELVEMSEAVIARNDPKLNEMFTEVTSLLTMIGQEIYYPDDSESEADLAQYEDSLSNIEKEYLPQLRTMIDMDGKGVASRFFMGNVMAVLLDKNKALLSFLLAASSKLQLSGMSGVAFIIGPFIHKLRENPRLNGALSFMQGKAHSLEESVNTLNQVTGGMIKPLNDLSTAIGGLNMAVDMIMDESVKTPREMMDYVIQTLIEVNEEDERLVKAMNILCSGLERVELDMEEETRVVTVEGDEEEEEEENEEMAGLEQLTEMMF